MDDFEEPKRPRPLHSNSIRYRPARSITIDARFQRDRELIVMLNAAAEKKGKSVGHMARLLLELSIVDYCKRIGAEVNLAREKLGL